MKNNDNDKNNVKIAIRWRPAIKGRQVAIEKVDEKIISLSRRQTVMPSTFMLDYAFDSVDSQCEVYDVLVKPLVDKAFDGYDATFIAIGQTGSGKTYTIGFENSVTSKNDNGMTARILDSVYSHEKQIEVSISFIEIYNDQAFDLLNENAHQPFCKKDHRLSAATKKPVSKENVVPLLLQAVKRRRVRGTNMNSVSSRSHAVLTIYLAIDGRESGINLVDLAGSEGFQKTGNTGDAHMEGKSINESLSAFKRVINAMARGENHIPYRDSVITKLLSKSLNTHSYLTLLGCVSPYQDDFGETLSTVRFVSEAKNIKATPQQNAVIFEYQKSKTPVKGHQIRTPNSLVKSVGTFKKPLLMSSAHNRNKQKMSRIPMSEPRKNLLINARSDESMRLNGNLINSTTKKSNLFRQSVRTSLRRSRAVTNLFPTTISRQQIEESLQNDETIDWENVSTSSILCPEPVPNMVVSEKSDTKLDQYMDTLMRKVKPIVADKLKNDPNLKMLNFRLADTEVADLSHQHKSIESAKQNSMLSPIQSQSNMNEFSVIFGDENERNDSQIDFADLAVDIDTANKQIVIDVSMSFSQNPHQIQNQSQNAVTSQCECDEIKHDSYMIRNNTRLTRSLNNTLVKSLTEIDSNLFKSSEAVIIDDSVEIYTTPIAQRLSYGERTPIGKIRLRRVTPKTVTPELNTPDDETYEIVMVQSIQHSQMCQEHFDSVKMMHKFEEIAPAIDYPVMPMNTTIANKATAIAHPFPLSPRIILHRIESIDEYNRSTSQQRTRTRKLKAVKNKTKHTKKDRVQHVPSSGMQSTKKILNLLNTGSEKEIQKLWTIGKKTASSIFDFRLSSGGFKNIDALKEMPFWTKNMHKKFLEMNGIK